MSMCAHGTPSATNSRRNSAALQHVPGPVHARVDLRDVGDIGVHALADVVRQRHRPGRLADPVAGRA